MRRREYLRTAAGVAGLSGLATGALRAAASGRSARDPSDAPTTTTANGTTTPTPTGTPTGTPEAPDLETLGSIDLPGAREVVVGDAGGTAYVAKTDGFSVVDISDPASPALQYETESVVEDLPGGPMRAIYDVSVDGDYLLVAGPGGPSERSFQGFAVYDVSDPASPDRRRVFEQGQSIHNCCLDGHYAYLTGDGVYVVDVEPADPEVVATWAPTDHDEGWAEVPRILRNLHDVWVENGRAYLAYWDTGTWILDVSDPADPAVLGRASTRTLEELQAIDEDSLSNHLAEPPGNAHYAQADHDRDLLAVGGESWDSNADADHGTEDDLGGPSGVDLYDIADPADPALLATIAPPSLPEGAEEGWTTAHNFELRGGYLFASWYNGGVSVHDVTDPAKPETLGRWKAADRNFWTAQVGVPGEFFVASDLGQDLRTQRGAGLLTFADPTDLAPAGTPVGGPDISPTATPTPTPTPSPTPTPTPSPTDSPTPTPTPSPTDSPTPTATTGGTTEGSGPGFGPFAALAGLGLGAWRLLGDGGDDDGDA